MKLRLRRDRLTLGLRGLALLRGWPFGDPDEAERHVRAIRTISDDNEPEWIELDDDGLSAAYADWSQTYDEPRNPVISTEEPIIREQLSALPTGRALDAACGTGRLTGVLADLGHDVVAVDASAEMLAKAKAKGIRAGFVQGELGKLPFATGSVDLVTCTLALTHVTDLHGPILDLGRVVRPGGSLILSDMHPLAVATGAQAFFIRPDGTRGLARNHVHWHSAYVESFRGAGLAIDACIEPLVDETFGQDVTSPEVRAAIADALIGLPP